jgi:hypothetical protein
VHTDIVLISVGMKQNQKREREEEEEQKPSLRLPRNDRVLDDNILFLLHSVLNFRIF